VSLAARSKERILLQDTFHSTGTVENLEILPAGFTALHVGPGISQLTLSTAMAVAAAGAFVLIAINLFRSWKRARASSC